MTDGLRNMRQRMDEIGGTYRIQSRVGQGTEIIVELPWPRALRFASYHHPMACPDDFRQTESQAKPTKKT
jgi:hypothetical protein